MTYTVRNINHVPDQDRLEVIDACNRAILHDQLVSVQLEEFDDEVTLYGVYTNDADWVENYYRSGGIWEYMCPRKFLYG